MAKNIERKCPACGLVKSFREDQLTCGCKRASALDESARLTYLRKDNARLLKQVQDSKDFEGFREELSDNILSVISALEPLPPVPFTVGKEAESEIAAVLKLSDWHIGAVIKRDETEGFGAFNWAIAQERAGFIAQKFMNWIGMHRRSFNIPDLHVFCEGDWVSGDIHQELQRTNEFPLPVQAVNAGALLAQTVSTLAPHFKNVFMTEVGADNHGRLQPKPQFKQKSFNNMSFVTYSVANALLAKHGNILPTLAKGIKELVNVNDNWFLLEHGDTVKAWMGIPYYGMERSRAREASRRMTAMLAKKRHDEFFKYQREVGFDYISTAHWHVPGIVSGNILINGSLTGTDEFDHGCGRSERPAQVSFLVHPKYGHFDWTAWRPKR